MIGLANTRLSGRLCVRHITCVRHTIPRRQVRYKTMAPSILLRDEEMAILTDSSVVANFGGALDHDVDLSGLAEDTPVTIW